MTRSRYAPEPTCKTFVLEADGEPWPVETTPDDHTFGCWTLEEAVRDAVLNMLDGYACRIVATAEWERRHGPLNRQSREGTTA